MGHGLVPLTGGGGKHDTAFRYQLAGEAFELVNGSVLMRKLGIKELAHALESAGIAHVLGGQHGVHQSLLAVFGAHALASGDGLRHDGEDAGLAFFIHVLEHVVTALQGIGCVGLVGDGVHHHAAEHGAGVLRGGILAALVENGNLLVSQLLEIPALRAAGLDVAPEGIKGGFLHFCGGTALHEIVVHIVTHQGRGALGVNGRHVAAHAVVELHPGLRVVGHALLEHLGMSAVDGVIARLGFFCLQVKLVGLLGLVLQLGHLGQGEAGVGKARGVLLLSGYQVSGEVQGGIVVVIHPRAPVQAALPVHGIGGGPLAVHPDHVSAVAGLAHGEAGHAVGAGCGGAEVGETSAHAAHILGELVVVVQVHALKRLKVGGAVNAVAVHIVQDIAAAPAAAGVAVIGHMHIVQCPGKAFGLAGAVVPLPAAGHTTQQERHVVELLVQAVLAPVAHKVFGALAGVVHRPAEAGVFNGRGGGNLARHAVIGQHAGVAFHHVG